MGLSIATWNVNSVRKRIDQMARLIDRAAIDVLCLQETKVQDHLFPLDAFRQLGFVHAAVSGQKSYNGVAILSRLPLTGVATENWCARPDCRHIHASVDAGPGIGPVRVHSLYVPAGGDLPDPAENPKFAHKLEFMAQMAGAWGPWLLGNPRHVLAGDFNVAPLASDVWDHKSLLKIITHTPVETDLLAEIQRSDGWIDAVRAVIPPDQPLYTWWSYRARDWRAANRGRRLDHVWVSPALGPSVADARVIIEARDWNPPSDHAPVVVRLE